MATSESRERYPELANVVPQFTSLAAREAWCRDVTKRVLDANDVIPREDAEAVAQALHETLKVVGNDGTWLWAHEKLTAYRLAHPPGPEPEGTK